MPTAPNGPRAPQWIATIPLQGADESNTRIQWTPNNHININVYTQTKITLKDGDEVEIPCYHHAFIAPPKGARSLDTIQREWHKGYLILSFKSKSESTPSANASLQHSHT